MNSFFIWMLPLVLLLIGLFGNTVGFIVFSRRSLTKFPARNIYRTLAVMDSFYLLHIILQYLLYFNGLSIRLISDFSCKVVRYLNYSLAPISAWLLVYLSIHKFICIRFREFNSRLQSLIIFMIILYNLVYYLPILLIVGLVHQTDSIDTEMNTTSFNNDTNETIRYECNYSVVNQENIYSWMDLLNLTILPFSLMIVFATLLIITIFQSRLRILRMSAIQDRNRLNKDIKFAVTSILLNFIFIILNLPICIANVFFEVFYSYYDAFLSIYYISYCINFYILFFFNSIFRKEAYLLFKVYKK